jgi:hypothetical protein
VSIFCVAFKHSLLVLATSCQVALGSTFCEKNAANFAILNRTTLQRNHVQAHAVLQHPMSI